MEEYSCQYHIGYLHNLKELRIFSTSRHRYIMHKSYKFDSSIPGYITPRPSMTPSRLEKFQHQGSLQPLLLHVKLNDGTNNLNTVARSCASSRSQSSAFPVNWQAKSNGNRLSISPLPLCPSLYWIDCSPH